MSVVTPTTKPATLLKHEQELMIAHPHLSPGHVRQLVKDQPPELWAHQGLNEAPEPTVDPGEILNHRVYLLQASGYARSFAEAVEIAMRQLPEEAAAYNAGLRLPARQVRQNAAPAPPAALERPRHRALLHLVEEKIRQPDLVDRDAQTAILAADPQLARHYSEASPLPVVAKPKVPVTERWSRRAVRASPAHGRDRPPAGRRRRSATTTT